LLKDLETFGCASSPLPRFFYEDEFGATRTTSALVGAIWQVNDKLSFDIGLRHAWVDGQQPVNEIRLGLTFGIPMPIGRAKSSLAVSQAAAQLEPASTEPRATRQTARANTAVDGNCFSRRRSSDASEINQARVALTFGSMAVALGQTIQ
jgi:hypothetical protein